MNEKLIEKLNSYIDENRDNIVNDLIAVSSIESVSLEGDPVKPFGPGCRKVIDHMLAKGEAEGFKTHKRPPTAPRIMNTMSARSNTIWARKKALACWAILTLSQPVKTGP